MNIEDYIKSGIIEDYCLGFLSTTEMELVVKNALQYKEISIAIEAFETALKKYAAEWAINKKNKEDKNDERHDGTTQ
jgi:hypothetical protein